ncbi:MAG: acetyl-CoA carboxylase biotin carboxylase subunit [Calditrichaeota bacterium]|nr:acetyl-CoA carboxylase biotin carboxylase subunit [Calditrichota bacterium]
MKQPIQRILIANRGEIARRVIQACKELNIETVAIYSDVDKYSPHVLDADMAVEIGPAPPTESYLNMDRIIAVARETRCQAIHPGYGFLAENAEFARRCVSEGILFIGPTPEAMALVGNKLKARQTVMQAGVPIIPGMQTRTQQDTDLEKIVQQIGFPIMIKAAAGGGGKGMRIVREFKELQPALEASQREARSAFGDDTVYLEKFIERPRHVEVQVLADAHGNIVHLFERECSIQRRHQKIVEESPSPALDPDLRQKMGETACRVMEAVGYTNAGTVEFLLDADKNFYFLEVNARIQVEHPVTELVTGIDLVKQQIRIAAGEPLPFSQEQIQQKGHAIECRIYAEDPENQFLPSIGKLIYVQEPQGAGIRCDSGIYSRMEVTHHYDPILSKVIVWDQNREAAIARMLHALSHYVILGIQTPIPFLIDLLSHPEFRSGNLHTHFLEEHFSGWKPRAQESERALAIAIAAFMDSRPRKTTVVSEEQRMPTPWESLGRWELLS